MSSLPSNREAITDGGHLASITFRRFLEGLNNLSLVSSEDIASIATALGSPDGTVANIPPQDDESLSFVINGGGSVSVTGTVEGGVFSITLANDTNSPGNTYYYGADETGQKGWFAVADALAADAGELEKTVGADGITSFGLADLADSGAGTFKLITRDAKGRVSGTANGDTDDVPEGANLYFTDARVLAALPIGYIDGLTLSWNSGTSISAASGAAHIEGLGTVLESGSTLTASSLSLSASTWCHVYLYSNAGAPTLEVVTTAPVLYNGTARSKTGDTTRRYLGSVLTDSGGNVTNFLQSGVRVQWRTNAGAAPFRALSGGVATVSTSVSLAAVTPVTSRIAQIRPINTATNAATLRIGTSDDSSSGIIAAINPTSGTVSQAFIEFPMDASQAIVYHFSIAPTGGSAIFDILGYTFQR